MKPVKHDEEIPYLKKIEGQIRGVQRMIEEKRYCIDILTQLESAIGAITRIENKVLKKHIEGCVVDTLKGKSRFGREKKINEVIELISRFRRTA